MPNQIDDATKQQRAEVLSKIGHQLQAAFLEQFNGQIVTVLVEGVDKKTGYAKGLTTQHLEVLIPVFDQKLNDIKQNQIIDLRINSVNTSTYVMMGTPI